MAIIAVGSVAYDSLKTPFGERERVLGGSATHFSMGASLFTKVNLVGVVGKDFREEDIELLKNRGVNLEGLVRKEGKTFFWKGEYRENLNEAITHDTQLNVFAEFDPIIPESYMDSNILFLGNIHPALQLKVIHQVENRVKFIAADTMNLWINTTPDELKEVIKKVNLIFVNDGEARLLTGENIVVKAAKKILDMGPDFVCIKRGEYGASLFSKNDTALLPAFPVEKVIDPTGAGDTFAAGFLGYVDKFGNFSFDTFREGLKVGTVLSSFQIEDFSVDRMKTITLTEVENRLNLFRNYIR